MKKFIFLIASLFVATGAFADEYSIQVKPTILEANKPICDEEGNLSSNYLQFYLHEGSKFESGNIVALQIKVYLPENMTVQGTYYDVDNDEIVDAVTINGDTRAFKAGPKRTWSIQSAACSLPNYKAWLIAAYCQTGTKILRPATYADANGNGSICKLYVGTEGVAEGTYPVYVENVELAETSTLYYRISERTTSYISVGTPSEVTLPVQNGLASFVTSELDSKTSLDLTSATKVYGNLDISNVGITALPEAGIAVEGTTSYTRNLSTQYGTVCVPFELTSTEETQYYALSNIATNQLTFQPVDVVPAGTPALVKGNISASVNNATLVAPVSGEMVGTYSNVVPGAVGYFIGQDKFWALEPTTKVGSYKAYIPTTLSAKSLKIFIEDETGIHEVSSEISSDDIYNLQGMKLNKTQKGINIVGGKKVILK